MFRCDFDVMESLENLDELEGSEHSPCAAPLQHASTLLAWHCTAPWPREADRQSATAYVWRPIGCDRRPSYRMNMNVTPP